MAKNSFIISFAGLKNGTHYFEFEINDSFFDLFEYSEVAKGELNVRMELVKSDNLLSLDIKLTGEVEVECDKCLDRFFTPIIYNSKLYVKINDSLADENNTEDNDMIIISTNDHEIDISQYLYECIILSLPLKKNHPLDEEGNDLCNKKMLKLIEEHTDNENIGEIDPRWNKLKNL